MSFGNFIREYFTFNRRERNGVFVLLLIILALLFYLFFSGRMNNRLPVSFSQFDKEIADFEADQRRMLDSVSARGKDLAYNRKYGMDRTGSDRNIPGGGQVKVEINAADTTELKKIRGIGSVFAKRIIKFRDALGGFTNREQLLEVYGFDRDKLQELGSQMLLDSLLVKKININTASVEDLNNHPYINKKEAVAIFMRRVNTGDYSDLRELKKLETINDSLFEKIAPYLTIK